MNKPDLPQGILLRDRLATDLSFVIDTWLKTWRTSKWAGVVPNHLYYTTQRTLIEDLIARGAVITCAVDELAPRTPIAGWVCGEVKEEKSVFHYAFVRHNYLGKGLEQALIDSLPGYKPGFMTHRLPLKELTSWTHLPELCRRKEL